MHRSHNPPSLGAPGGRYSHAVEVAGNARWLYLSGQVGAAPDGTVPADFTAQAEMCWRNIEIILADAGMGLADVVSYTTYLARREDAAAFRAVRDRFVGDARPAAVVVISQLVRPEWLIEIAVVAAKA
jgi:2-iminobutanoate/2-iminopropanoate deaminase